jgi:EpsI family protein
VTSRRDLLVGALCLCGAGTAYALEPRRRVSLLGHRSLASLIPDRFGPYRSRDVTDLVAPREDSLASRLYGQTVGRVYTSADGGPEVMMLLAHGDTQNDDLQLHRPEICYPFFGYTIVRNQVLDMPLAPGASLPCRTLAAQAPDRSEIIVYWSRLGQYLPLDQKRQQIDRLETAMKGEIADGLLSRFSVAGGDPGSALAAMTTFIPALIRAVPADGLNVLIGDRLAALVVAAAPRA